VSPFDRQSCLPLLLDIQSGRLRGLPLNRNLARHASACSCDCLICDNLREWHMRSRIVLVESDD
jgi:hypothetical protein